MSNLSESLKYVRSKIPSRPRTAIVLGSGLGNFAKKLVEKVVLDCSEIPHYPVPQVEGHAGHLLFGFVPSSRRGRSSPVLAFVGRPHYYESGDLDKVTYPVRLAHALGVKRIILTNAAGGVNSVFSPGDLMLIAGQINMTFESVRLFRLRSMGREKKGIEIYDRRLRVVARDAAEQVGISLKEGVYCGVTGPSYETAAEIEMVRRLGADAVGMSTVLEAMTAKKLGLQVLGISLITNLATGLASEAASHEEVIRVARQAGRKFERLVTGVVSRIDS